MDELFCVIHKDLRYSAEKTADFLAVERCVDRAEAAAAFKKSPGFLLENASLGKSSAFNLRASAFGFETLLLSQHDLKSPPPAAVLSKIELKTGGFYYFSGGTREHLPFEAVKAVTACAITVEIPPRDAAAELEAGLIRSLRARYFPFALPLKCDSPPAASLPPAPVKETVFMADILTGSASLNNTFAGPLRLTLACDEHDYSGLGAKKAVSSFENFRILLEELSSRAFDSARNPFLRALLDKKDLTRLKHPSADAYEKELVWLMTVRRDDGKAVRL